MTRKRILSWVLSVAMCLSLVCVSALAAGETVEKAEWDEISEEASYEVAGLQSGGNGYTVMIYNQSTKESATYSEVPATNAGILGIDEATWGGKITVDGNWGIALLANGKAGVVAFKPFTSTEKVTVTFELNYTGAPAAQTVETSKGSTVTAPADPTRENYTFKGWAETADGTDAVNLETKTFDDNTTLYAIWEVVKVTITPPAAIPAVDGENGGYTFTVSPNPVDAGQPFTVTVNCDGVDPENKNGETVSLTYNGQTSSVPFSAAGSKGVTFTAAADATEVTASVTAGSKYSVQVIPAPQYGTVSAAPTLADSGAMVSVTATAKSGYRFTGWVIMTENGDVVPVANAEKTSFTMPAANVTVMARFQDDGSGTTPVTPIANLPISTGGTSGGSSTSGVRTDVATPSGGTPSGTTPVTPSTGFTDVPSGSWYAGSVDWAVSKGITNGVGGSKFDPDGTCTRAQMVTFLWRTAGSPAPSANAQSFSDVPAGAYYENAVKWAVENGVTNGVGDNRFNPDGLVTRAEAVTFLGRYTKGDLSGTPSFSDVPADSWFAGAVNWAVTNNVTNGMGDNQFQPNTTVTRAMAVTFLARANNA